MCNFRPPTPPPRKDVTDKFVSVVAVKDNSKGRPCCKWELDRQLASHLELCQQRDPQLLRLCQNKDEIGLVRYWLELLPKQPRPTQERRLIRNHLFAYLETPRYWAASNRLNAYSNLDCPQETWASYMFIAGAVASDPNQILEAFQKYDGNRETRLEKFFQRVLERKIQEGYYKESKTGKYSPWFELKRASKTKVKTGLQLLGLWEQEQIDRYLVARDCLFEVYSKTGERWLEPSSLQYQQAANFYNRHYPEGLRISWEMLAAWMADCISALQPFRTYSFDEAIASPGQDLQTASEELAIINPLCAIEEEEFAKMLKPLIASLNNILARTLANFEPTNRKILELRYGKKLSGAKIGKTVGLNQSNVSRRCDRCLRRLLEKTAEWIAQQHPGTDTKIIENLGSYIKEWLERHYGQFPSQGGQADL